MRPLVLLASAGLITAQEAPLAQNVNSPLPHAVTMPGAGSSSSSLLLLRARQAFCAAGQDACDADGCMAAGSACCGVGNGAFCDPGYYCVPGGCCQNGKTCSGPATGCLGDREPCGNYCVDKGTCSIAGGSGGGSSGGGPGPGAGGSSGGPQCPTGYELCDQDCMPKGGVCCHNGFHCDAGQTCLPDAKCQLGGGGSGAKSSARTSPASSSASASPTYVLTPHGSSSTTTGLATDVLGGGLTSKPTSASATGATTALSAPTVAPGSGGGSSGGHGGIGSSGSSGSNGSGGGSGGSGSSGSSGDSAPSNAALVNAPGALAASLALLLAVLL